MAPGNCHYHASSLSSCDTLTAVLVVKITSGARISLASLASPATNDWLSLAPAGGLQVFTLSP